MTATTRYELPPDAVLQITDGEAILMKLNDEDMFALNQTGAAIVQRIADGQTVDAVVDALTETYAVDRADVERDVNALIQDLVQRGLLLAVDGSR